jgi:hypothetical protein
MLEVQILDLLVGLMILALSASDLYKSFQMVFRDRHPLLYIAQVSFWIMERMPFSEREEKRAHAMEVYRRRRKIYGIFALLGAPWMILLSISIILNSITLSP